MSAEAVGADTNWIGTNGSWFDPTNWDTGVPASGTVVAINNGGTPQVAGPGAAASSMKIGVDSSGLPSFLEILNGGTLHNMFGFLGYASGSQGMATIKGTGSVWANSHSLYVGRYGTGTLNIENEGQVSSMAGYLGYYSGSQGMAKVTGSGSMLTISDFLSVGREGSGSLHVADGGLVNVGKLLASLSDLSGDGTITAKGAVLDADLVFDSVHGTQTTVRFGTGGQLQLTLDGTDDLGAGYKGIGTLTIAGGVPVDSYFGYLGLQTGSEGTATVTGTGSKWANTSCLYVGRSGVGTLNIEAGGQVSNSEAYLGNDSGSHATATVTGSGSTWTSSGDLQVGRSGTGTLKIENEGQVSSDGAWVGTLSGSHGTATVTGNGSMWMNTGNLYIGSSGIGVLNIENGGQVSNAYGFLGFESGSQGMVTVAGNGSKWANSASVCLQVGVHGSGLLNVEDGGQVFSSYGILGTCPGSQGTVVITGKGSKWINSLSLSVGDDGNGTLTLENDGEVSVGTTLIVRSTGSITLDGGTIDAQTITDTEGGNTDFRIGTLCFGTYQGSLTNAGCMVGARDGAYGLNVTGDYIQGPAGMLRIKVAGLPAGGLFDVLSVGGVADLAGTLALDFAGFAPSYNSTYNFLTAGSITGSFDAFTVTGLDPAWSVQYNIPAGRFTVVPEPMTLGLLILGGLGLFRRRR